MQKSMRFYVMAAMMLSLLTASCSAVRMPEGSPTQPQPLSPAYTQPAVVSLATQVPVVDPCSSLEAKKPEIETIARIMGEFDDTSYLIQSIPDSGQMVQVILVLQRIRRDAIDNKPPECLKKLKEAQVNFMSGVVLTSISIMSKSDKEAIQKQLAQTRTYRSVFDQELANQLGLKYITATPVPTTAPTAVPPTSTVSPVTATTDQDIYVVQGPGLTYPAVGTFLKGQITNVMGRNDKGDWIEIEVPSNPGYAGWVPKQLIKLAGQESSLPVINVQPTQPAAQ